MWRFGVWTSETVIALCLHMMTGNKNTAARIMTHCWHSLFSITLPVCFLVILLLKVMIPVGDKYRDSVFDQVSPTYGVDIPPAPVSCSRWMTSAQMVIICHPLFFPCCLSSLVSCFFSLSLKPICSSLRERTERSSSGTLTSLNTSRHWRWPSLIVGQHSIGIFP